MNISLKLISGHKVILAEFPGYDSELFVPVIVNNRITLQNAVASRRCCQSKPGEHLQKLPLNRLSIHNVTPLANSTPSHNSNKENVKCSIESFACPIRKRSLPSNSLQNQIKLPKDVSIKPLRPILQVLKQNASPKIEPPTASINEDHSGLPTPDIVRRAPIKCANDSITLPEFPVVTHLKIIPLHRVNTLNKSHKLAKVIRSTTPMANISSPKVLRNLSNVSSFASPPSLQRTNKTNSSLCGTPNQSFLARQIKTPGTATKWRKCITPQRTYNRSSKAQSKATNLQPLRLAKNGKFIEDYRYPINSASRFIVKKRKLIVDDNIKISPRQFKNQLTNTEDLQHEEKWHLPKSRNNYKISHMTAFDLLTNSGFYPKIGGKLNAVFRNGCVNKSSATILKYKQLVKDIPSFSE